jgi:hypothetical protein
MRDDDLAAKPNVTIDDRAMELAGLEPATSWVRSVSGCGLTGTTGDG